MTTIYKPIPGCPGYRAGSDGTIWSAWKMRGGGYGGKPVFVIGDKWRKLKPYPRKSDGRKRYTVKLESGVYIRRYGGVLVLESFVGPRPEGMECCHCNGDCKDDSASNLRWGTHSSNLLDRRVHGTNVQGEKINTAKLTEDQVREIRYRRGMGEKLKSLAAEYGVTETMVSYIYRRKAWTHVD